MPLGVDDYAVEYLGSWYFPQAVNTNHPGTVWPQFAMQVLTGGSLADVINCQFFGDRFRGFDSAWGRISAISIDLGCRR